MTVRTRAQLNSDADTNLADNTSGDIGADDVRASVKNLADSALLGEDIGTHVQAYHARLASLAGLAFAAGDLIYATGADTLARLAKGTDGQVLSLTAGVPAWVDAPSSGWDMTGQSWQAVTRVSGTQYQNTTGKPIVVTALVNPNSTTTDAELVVMVNTVSGTSGEVILADLNHIDDGSVNVARISYTFIVPPSHYYRMTLGDAGHTLTVRELR